MSGSLALRPPAPVDDAPADLPPARPWLPAASAVLPYLEEIDAARRYSNFGPQLEVFEQRLAARLNTPGATVVAASSGTQALALGLRALGAQPGWVCALPAWTFVATAHAVMQAGLTPWFLDVDEADQMLSPDRVLRTLPQAPGPLAAVMPVSAFGRRPDLEGWAGFREATGVPVLVDCAAGFDALDAAPVPAVVSLHATKALGVGEGGYLATEEAALAERARELSSFGFRGSREAHRPATNAKLSEYAAAIGRAALDAWPATRLRYLRAGRLMRAAMAGLPEVAFQPGWGLDWVSATCVVRLCRPAAPVAAALLVEGVETRAWWGAGCHASPAFSGCPRTGLPVTAALAETSLGLPFWADMTTEEIGRVAAALFAALRSGG